MIGGGKKIKRIIKRIEGMKMNVVEMQSEK